MKPLHTTLRLGILLLVLACSMGVTAQTSKTAQNNNQQVSLPSTNKGDTITDRVSTGKIYDVVDENPHFPGGNGAMLDWLSKNIHYSSGCASLQGRVVVSFYVEPDGSLSDIELVQKVDPEQRGTPCGESHAEVDSCIPEQQTDKSKIHLAHRIQM